MVGLVGLVALLGWTAVSRSYGMIGPLAALTAVPVCAIPMLLWSVFVDKVHLRPSTGIDWRREPRPLRETLNISIVKIAGLWGTWAAIAFFYCIARWYWGGQYLFAMYVLGFGSLLLMLASVPYIIWLDRRLKEPRDGAWHLGQWIAGRSVTEDREQVYDHLRCWAIKGFFLALMISFLPLNWINVIQPGAAAIAGRPVALAIWLANVTFMVDVTFATAGYMLTLKPLDAHIRSANPFAAAWMAALLCYPPFHDAVPLNYHEGGADWTYWLQGSPLVMALYGFALVALHIVYAWATVAFGIRFSNLTHRGIITNGPYAWTKHPAYISKNLFWWLTALPFLSVSGSSTEMIRNTALLGIVSGIYLWRAKSEERHLIADPVYRDYAAWIGRNGLLARLFRRSSPRLQPVLTAD
jgi:protein-S-isoprenylcysteine O-methyltransferase Ste14